MRFGMEGYGFYWGLVEILHESGGYIKESELAAIAYELRVSEELCNAVVKESGFFVVKKGKVTSDRVLRNLKKRAEISEARREAVNKRWKNEEGDGEEDPPPVPPFQPDKTMSDDLKAFLEEMHIKYYSRTIDEWKPWFEKQFGEWTTSMGLYDSNFDKVCEMEEIFKNILEELREKHYVTIEKKKVHVNDFLNVMQFFFSSHGRGVMLQVWEDVEKKYRTGRVKNKQNYLISALFIAAKMNGG
jgi:hypothetical protein